MGSERAEQLHTDLINQVAALRSSEDWLEAMTTAAMFHQYSFGNWLLLWSQAEQRGTTVTRPAGYRAWQKLGRNVRKGESGYQILAPMTRRLKDADESAKSDRVVVTGFRVVTVFDVAQTDGDALPDIGARHLEDVDHPDILNSVINLIESKGFSFGYATLSGPNGITSPHLRSVLVDDRLSVAQQTKTAIHELAHVILHSESAVDCRGRIEVEAESVAYVVCGALDFDTSTYSVPYVAGWSESTDDPSQTLLATAETVVRTARRILTALHTFHIKAEHTNA